MIELTVNRFHNFAVPGEKYLKCACSHCAGGIEFPPEGLGTTVPCPHCGRETELVLEATLTESDDSQRSRKWIVTGVIILAMGLLGAMGALVTAKVLARKKQTHPEVLAPSAQKSPSNPAKKPQPVSEPANTINNFAAFPVAIEKKARGSTLVYAVGTVRNETDKQRFGVTVEIDLFDGTGTKIGVAKDYKDIIEANAEWKFRALLVVKNVATARVNTVREQ